MLKYQKNSDRKRNENGRKFEVTGNIPGNLLSIKLLLNSLCVLGQYGILSRKTQIVQYTTFYLHSTFAYISLLILS